MCYSEIINNLNSLMKTSIEFDDRLYELTMDIKHNEGNPDRAGTYYEKF